MNKLKTAIVILCLAPFLFVTSVLAETVQIEFQVSNMQSLTDQYKVRKILSSLDGILKVILTDDENGVLLSYDDEASSLFDIKASLAAQGYPATNIQQVAASSSTY